MAADLDLRAGGSEAVWNRAIWTGHLAFQALWQPRAAFRAPAAIERAQGRRVRAMVRHAYRSVPHYRETMDRLGLRPEDFETAADLARLPLVDRADVQRDPLRFLSRDHPPDRCRRVQTGGSSGAPLTVFYPPSAFREAGYGERGRFVESQLTGRRWRPRVLVFSSPMASAGALGASAAQRIVLPRWMRREMRELSLLDPPAMALAAMNDFRPDVVHSYGSYLEAIFLHAHEAGGDFHRPRVLTYSGDALPDRARRQISDRLGIPVLSRYNATEASPIGFECERHRGLHLNVDLHPVRVVGEDGNELPVGRTGDVVVSNLVNRATVLLNYRLGDLARRLPGACPCRRSLPMLSLPEGRVGDWVMTTDGERMHPQGVRTLITDEPDIRRYQVAQRTPSHFAIVLVAAPDCDRLALEERLARKFIGRLGVGTTIDLEFTDVLPRTPGGKVRTVIGLPKAVAKASATGQVSGRLGDCERTPRNYASEPAR